MPFLKKLYTLCSLIYIKVSLQFSSKPVHECKNRNREKNRKSCKERASFPAFRQKGAVTAEACLCLTLFMAAALSILSFFHIIAIFSNVQYGLLEEARKKSITAEKEILDKAVLYSSVYRVMSEQKSKGGRLEKLSVLGSGIDENQGIINVKASYKFRPSLLILISQPVTIYHKVYIKMWSGYQKRQAEYDDNCKVTVYYITDNQSVYHTSRECTHLKLSIRLIEKSMLNNAVNHSGAHYSACEKCAGKGKLSDNCYITDDGDRYHLSLSCPGLKRIIHEVTDTYGLRKCSRCG